MSTISTSISLTTEQHNRIERVCKKYGHIRPVLIRRAINRELNLIERTNIADFVASCSKSEIEELKNILK